VAIVGLAATGVAYAGYKSQQADAVAIQSSPQTNGNSIVSAQNIGQAQAAATSAYNTFSFVMMASLLALVAVGFKTGALKL
jgi:hypothetical protein